MDESSASLLRALVAAARQATRSKAAWRQRHQARSAASGSVDKNEQLCRRVAACGWRHGGEGGDEAWRQCWRGAAATKKWRLYRQISKRHQNQAK
jgi:hypothetical protein